jgi:hypothetical protein
MQSSTWTGRSDHLPRIFPLPSASLGQSGKPPADIKRGSSMMCTLPLLMPEHSSAGPSLRLSFFVRERPPSKFPSFAYTTNSYLCSGVIVITGSSIALPLKLKMSSSSDASLPPLSSLPSLSYPFFRNSPRISFPKHCLRNPVWRNWIPHQRSLRLRPHRHHSTWSSRTSKPSRVTSNSARSSPSGSSAGQTTTDCRIPPRMPCASRLPYSGHGCTDPFRRQRPRK